MVVDAGTRASKPMGAGEGRSGTSAPGRPKKPIGKPSVPPHRFTHGKTVVVGAAPQADGDVTSYAASPLAGFGAPKLISKRRMSPRLGLYQVLYVNGMAGNPEKHRAQAGLVAAFSGGSVWGVYNAPGEGWGWLKNWPKVNGVVSVLQDIIQCGSDKLTAIAAMKSIVAFHGGEGSVSARDKLAAFFKGELITIGPNQARTIQLKGNPAIASLFLKLASLAPAECRIVCHSQGNLITCAALGALVAWKGDSALKGITVHAVASPTDEWPAGLVPFHYAFKNDAIAKIGSSPRDTEYLPDMQVAKEDQDPDTEEILRYTPVPTNPKTGQPMHENTHNFYSYVENYWDVLVSRFP